eukprot:297055-Alexandrium_andersonii.AAC.1
MDRAHAAPSSRDGARASLCCSDPGAARAPSRGSNAGGVLVRIEIGSIHNQASLEKQRQFDQRLTYNSK